MADEALQNHKREFLKPKKQKAGTWVDDEKLPPVGVKVSASSRDPATASSRDPATVKGVRHKKCPAKMLRERLHNRRNHLRKMERPRFSTSQKRRTQPAGRRENRSRVPSARASVAWRKI